jgi:hypothetical protein
MGSEQGCSVCPRSLAQGPLVGRRQHRPSPQFAGHPRPPVPGPPRQSGSGNGSEPAGSPPPPVGQRMEGDAHHGAPSPLSKSASAAAPALLESHVSPGPRAAPHAAPCAHLHFLDCHNAAVLMPDGLVDNGVASFADRLLHFVGRAEPAGHGRDSAGEPRLSLALLLRPILSASGLSHGRCSAAAQKCVVQFSQPCAAGRHPARDLRGGSWRWLWPTSSLQDVTRKISGL